MPTMIDTYKESDGKSVTVTLSSTVLVNEVVYAGGWLGVAARYGVSGDRVALTIEEIEYQLTVPSGLAVSAGQTIWVDVGDTTGHSLDSTALYTAAGANRIRLARATADKNADNVVTVIFIGGLGLS